MADSVFTVQPTIFLHTSPLLHVQNVHENSLTGSVLAEFLGTGSDTTLGLAAVYGSNCTITHLAISTRTAVLIIRFSTQSSKRKRIGTTSSAHRPLSTLLCHDQCHLYCFGMDRLALSLHLDLSLKIANGRDLLPASNDSRRSLRALMSALGGDTMLRKRDLELAFEHGQSHRTSLVQVATQAWVACMTSFSGVTTQQAPIINTTTWSDGHLSVLAKIARDGQLKDALKPTIVENEVKTDYNTSEDGISVTSTRFRTRIMPSSQQKLEINLQTPSGQLRQVGGKTRQIDGRQAVIALDGLIHGTKLMSIKTIGKEDSTNAENSREEIIRHALYGAITLIESDLFRRIWMPRDVSYPSLGPTYQQSAVAFPKLNLSADSGQDDPVSRGSRQSHTHPRSTRNGEDYGHRCRCFGHDAAREQLSSHPMDSGSIQRRREKHRGEISKSWFQTVQAPRIKRLPLRLHEHLYEEIEEHVIRSDMFSIDLTMISGLLDGVRVILCTLSMFSNDRLGALMQMVPVQAIIFDEASQIEVGDYLPVLHRCQKTLEKMVFIGDDKQLAPFGSDDIELESIFEIPHLRQRAHFLDTQYRMPTVIGNFISSQLYDGKLKSVHRVTDLSACFFVNVRGQETAMGRSWMNEEEIATVVRLARFFIDKGQSYRIITPYDAQRSLIERALDNTGLPWENKCFNVDAFQGNEDDHIIVSLVRTERIGFIGNVRRTNVMLTRCRRSMVICTDRAFMSGAAQDTLPAKLARRLGQGNWLHEMDILNGYMGALASVIN